MSENIPVLSLVSAHQYRKYTCTYYRVTANDYVGPEGTFPEIT